MSNARLIAAGLVAKKLVGASALVRMVVAKRACSARRWLSELVAQLADDVADGLCGGEVAALDPGEDRVARPGRVGEAPVALARLDLGAAQRDAHELAAQLRGLAGDGAALAERRGQAATVSPIDGTPTTSPPSGDWVSTCFSAVLTH